MSGLALTFIMDPTGIQRTTTPPPYVAAHCAALGRPSAGNAAGHDSLTNFGGLTLGPYRQVMGFTPAAYAALSGCVVAALAGIAGIGVYTFGGDVI